MYDVYDLGLPQGYASGEALSVNSLGHAVGCCSPNVQLGNPYRAFLWENGTQVDLGTLGEQSIARSINDRDLVVGESEVIPFQDHAFIWSKATGMQDLGLPGPVDASNTASGINNLGSIVGSRLFANPYLRTAAGFIQDLPKRTGVSDGYALNDKDEVVGWPDLDLDLGTSGFFWSGGNETDLLPLPRWWPSAVNFSGIVTGTRDTGRAFRWHAGAGVELNPLPGDTNSFGMGINDKGVIVGGSFDANAQPLFGRAVIWSAGIPKDLNMLAANRPLIKMHSANWIANTGTIVGRGSVNGVFRPFIAFPRDDSQKVFSSDIGIGGIYMNVLGCIPAGGSGIAITSGGHIIPWPPPNPMSQMRSAIDSALSAIQDPELRQQMEARLLAAVERVIREGSGGH